MSVFYEKLASAKEDKKKKRSAKDALKGVGLGLAGAAGGFGLQEGSLVLADKTLDVDPENLERLVKSMGAKKQTGVSYGIGSYDAATDTYTPYGRQGDIYDLRTKDGRIIELKMGAGKKDSMMAGYSPGSRYDKSRPNARGTIRLDRGVMDEDTFFHELGHATGRGAKSRNMKRLDKIREIMDHKGFMIGEVGGGLAAAGLAGSARNKKEADRANMAANAVLGLSAARHLPLLAEEARASIRAHGLKKKFTGRGARLKGTLIPSFGSYLGNALMHAAPGITAKVLAKRKQRQFKNEEK